MDPVTLVAVGVVAYKFLRGASPDSSDQTLALTPGRTTAALLPLGTQGAGTSSQAPLANTTTREGIPLGEAMQDPALGPDQIIIHPGDQVINDAQGHLLYVVPGDLAARLDNETAMMLRAYVALDPPDFHAWLDRYARYIVLRNDMHLEKLENPIDPNESFQPTPAMLARMGNAAYKIGQAINGVAVGRSVDLFGVGASAAGAIPGMEPNLVTALQAAALTYNAIQAIAALNGVSMNLVSALSGGAFLGTVTADAYLGLANVGVGVQALGPVLMAVGLVVDIGFTIIGNKPDMQKAVDVALDVASLVCLFIPVIGWVIAIVIQLVKFIIDLFGDDLFGGGGADHDLREALETARYGANLNPMFPQIVNALTPRELLRSVFEWGAGYCGGKHIVAMAVFLRLKAGDRLTVAGQPYTVPKDIGIGYLYPGCPSLPQPYRQMSYDELAWALAVYAPINGVQAEAQAGIAESLKTQFNVPTQNLIKARAKPLREFLVTYHLSLDQIDAIVLEYRAQPHLQAMAQAFGWHVVDHGVEGSWQVWLGSIVHAEWDAFNSFTTHGTLSDFAARQGYPSMYALRAAALRSWETVYARVEALKPKLLALTAWYESEIQRAADAAAAAAWLSAGSGVG